MMVTTFDDEDLERSARAMRQRFRFSDGTMPAMPKTCTVSEWNRRAAEHARKVSLRLSQDAARLHFEAMGAQYMPTAHKAA